MKAEGYDYDRFGAKGQRAGQAVYDIMSKEQSAQTVEETLEEWGPDFAVELERCIQDNKDKYAGEFYVFVLTKKEMWATNLVRNWFIARNTEPAKGPMMVDYPHATKTVYKVNPRIGGLDLVWTIPGIEDCRSIASSPQSYDPSLNKWIAECFQELQEARIPETEAPATLRA